MPLLCAVGHQSIANARECVRKFDDIGFSRTELQLHDSWEILLTTVTPITHLPRPDLSSIPATGSIASALSRQYTITRPYGESLLKCRQKPTFLMARSAVLVIQDKLFRQTFPSDFNTLIKSLSW
ncbi:predicted protein [Coccidioides posadasii str. Silveira]|uniref:Predicted protein n=2 Tax=Coccidioides posadasii TaxID=199306 RepID=E9DCH9_COCPS|nr:predicted protein [Coccidioides posadasii str. Silveira]KMM69215.1 hypothetical protein CPAG_05536 [Coccidioides posadasii RMSCC 3488]